MAIEIQENGGEPTGVELRTALELRFGEDQRGVGLIGLWQQHGIEPEGGLLHLDRLHLIVGRGGHGESGEIEQQLGTFLKEAILEARSNSILFTGPAPGVGKSFISVNFAVVLAQAGKKVLLLDADLRKGHLHLPFGLSREHGLSEYIGEGLELDAVTHQTAVENLYFIPTGVLPPNPSELLMHDRFSQLLKQAESSYDLVLLDSPPVLAATAAVIIGQHAGATLMVIRAGVHPMRQLKDTVKRLRQGGSNLRGVVFNDMPLAPSRYGYGYRKYAYRYSYKDK